MKILHTADWHYRDKDHDEIEKCVDFLVASARQEQPDVILISGDITDSQNLKLDSKSAKTIFRQVSELADVAPVAIIIGTPSHDGTSAEILRYARGYHQIHVSEKPEQLFLAGGGLHTVDSGIPAGDIVKAVITQIPTPTKQFFQSESSIHESDREIAGALSGLLGAFGAVAAIHDCPHILSGHFQMGGAYISDTQQLIGQDIEITMDQIAMANATCCCLGHIHKKQQMGWNVFYSGSIYRKTFGEAESKGFYYHEINDDYPAVQGNTMDSRFVKTPTRQMIKISEDFTVDDAVSKDILPTILDTVPTGAHIKFELKVWQDEAGEINQAGLEAHYLELGAERVVVDLIRTPRETVRATRVLKAEFLREKVTAMAELRMEAVPESILAKADLLEKLNIDDLVKVVGRVN